MPSNMKIESLIERVKAGDANALKFIYDTYSPIMRGVCINITKEDEDTVDDLVQDAFMLAYSSLDKLNNPQKFREWLITITKNVSLRHLEKKKRHLLTSISSCFNEVMEVADTLSSDSMSEEKDILELISKLPTGYGKVFRLAVIEGYSHKEIAKMLDIEPHSSSSQLARAKAMLRSLISKRFTIVLFAVLVSIPLCKLLFKKEEIRKKNSIAKNGSIKPKYEKKGVVSHIDIVCPSSENYVEDISYRKPPFKSPRVAIDTNYVEEKIDTSIEVNSAMTKRDSILFDTIKIVMPEIENFIAEDSLKQHKQKWQFLAMGSLGSAFVQNAYRWFAANNSGGDDPDGPTPIIPSTIDTWEDYYKFLQEKEYVGTTADTLALIEIAKHNNGKIVEHEHHDKPVTFGISLAKSIVGRWKMETGLQYSFLKSNFILGEGKYFVDKVQKVYYLGIPLRMSYKWAAFNGWSAYASTGILLDIPLYGKVNERYVTGATVPYKNSWHFTPACQCSLGAGLGVQYNLARNWSIYVEPTFNWYIPNGSAVRTVWTEHPFTFTVPFGIRYTW